MAHKTEVRIRGELEESGRLLCSWPIDALDDLFSNLRKWGVYYDEEDRFSFTGQFRHDETGTYFEVVIVESEE